MTLEGLVIAAIVVVMVVLGAFAFAHRDDYSDACKAAGGRVHHTDTSGYKYVNGKWGYVVDGFDQCLSSDGRIIEV